MIGVKLMARINNVGVILELIGATLLIVLLAFHFSRGPGIVFDTLGLGEGHEWGYFGAFIIGGIMSAYVMYGFDTAGTLAEETNDPRRNAPPAIIKALATASLIGGVMILFRADGRQRHPRRRTSRCWACPTSSSRRWATRSATIFLIDSAIAITVCCLAVHTSCIRMMFAMARDDRAARSARRWRACRAAGKVPIVPALVVGVLAIALLAINIGHQSASWPSRRWRSSCSTSPTCA